MSRARAPGFAAKCDEVSEAGGETLARCVAAFRIQLSGDYRKAPAGGKVCGIYIGVLVGALIVCMSILKLVPGTQACESAVDGGWANGTTTAEPRGATTTTTPVIPPGFTPAEFAIAAVQGNNRISALQSTALVIIADVSVFLCTVTSAYVVVFKPELAPPDFETKGTLSNSSQDMSKPEGRMFAVMLFTAAMLSIVSMYTLHIHQSWLPWSTEATELNPGLQSGAEMVWRILWVVVPNVGLLYTALLPSLSDTSGTNIALTIVHNISAPLAIAFALIMETVQLAYGENAFAYFACGDDAWANHGGPLGTFPRLRVIVLCYAWIAALSFLSIQIYLGVGSVLGVRVKTSYCLCLVSFFCETTALVLAYALPAIQGIAFSCFEESVMPVMWEAQGINKLVHLANTAAQTPPS